MHCGQGHCAAEFKRFLVGIGCCSGECIVEACAHLLRLGMHDVLIATCMPLVDFVCLHLCLGVRNCVHSIACTV